ncbi:MAG: hypothetical protein H6604_05055 [Flavobacteriales bacterium]|nr:hypothetical protein [Flavobacteriales bacterium]
MKTLIILSTSLLLLLGLNSGNTLVKCTQNKNTTTLSNPDKESLLFMLEEEKLARDTYCFFRKKMESTSVSKHSTKRTKTYE